MKIFFVGGVHGVGKTTTCDLIAANLNMRHFVASALIREGRDGAIRGETKLVRDIASNQALLLAAFHARLPQSTQDVILDGHFTLLDDDRKITSLAPQLFADLHVDMLFCIRDEPGAICKRLMERDGVDCSMAMIERHQHAELEHARQISVFLKRPLEIIEAFDASVLQNAMSIG